MTRSLRRPGRWWRRTRWMAGEIARDLGLREPGGPAWLRDNPFLVKASRAEVRRFSLGWRLAVALGVLGGLLLGGLWTQRAYPGIFGQILFFLLGMPFPAALFVFVSFAHMMLVTSARTALTPSVGDEARRGTLPDLLLTPLRRPEMLLAMGIGPARSAFLVALAGLPVYVLMAEFGGLSLAEIALLYLVFALVCYAPPTYALPLAPGIGPTLVTTPTPTAFARRRRASGSGPLSVQWLWPFLSLLFASQILGIFGGGWFGHLLTALHLSFSMGRMGRILLIFAWPYYLLQILSGRIDFFHLSLPPLLFVFPLIAANWAAGALSSAAALSAGEVQEMQTLPLYSRAQTLARWVARAAGFLALGVAWKAWVESGDTATLAGGVPGQGGWDAAGLALLLGGLSLPNACRRAMLAGQGRPRSPALVLRRALKRAARPLRVAGLTFLLACALGGLSPFVPAVYPVVGRVALAGTVSILWGVGLARLLPAKEKWAAFAVLYGLPIAALALPLPILWNAAALSPAAAWVRLFPGGSDLLQRFPLWRLGALPPFSACIAGAGVTGLLMMVLGGRKEATNPTPGFAVPSPLRRVQWLRREGPVTRGLGFDNFPSPRSGEGTAKLGVGFVHNAAQTAALMAWITARTDNPLFTYEMRTRTRSGRWADWRFLLPGAFLAVVTLALAYPDVVLGFTFLSPFHFFGPGAGSPYRRDIAWVWADLASLLLTAQCYALGFRGQIVGESLIARDRQRGIWGFILLTPLSSRQIFWGKVFGQTSGFAAIWTALSLCSLILYLMATPAAGPGPAFIAWLVGQAFVAALFVLGVGLGASLATFPIFGKALRGASTLLFVGLMGLGLYGNKQVFDFDLPNSWQLTTQRLLLGSLYALALAAPLFAFAEWRLRNVRNRDIPFGDGVE